MDNNQQKIKGKALKCNLHIDYSNTFYYKKSSGKNAVTLKKKQETSLMIDLDFVVT